jgi:very-short-patch-repair endonuclease
MNKRNIVVGPKSREKQERAKEFRREMTEAEALLWSKLRGNQCGGLHFRRQQVIDGFIADFYCHSVGLIVEVDGGVHQQQADYDQLRDKILATRGLKIIRLSNDRILTDLQAVLAEIAEV